ncbi:hypothetical protein [Streptomyces kanamyceticus]|uniref:VCBS repeat-containing protein n=1 Tax=Streptomyces kanamyceticus TaxID=1967 RepID=A0A5J6G442_STRKN|nr:hypothetical protein CP970_00695 [Streptomyces kanamyceticus]
MALADLDGDGCDELAVLTQDFPGRGATGTYWIVPGSPRGPVPSRAERLDASRIGRG